MIKARAGSLVLLGLSRANVERLMNDQPIRFDGAELGLPGFVFVIMGGETEQAIADVLRSNGLVDEQTVVDDRWPEGVPR